MKIYILLITVFLTMFKINAQVAFCPAGAEWNYLFYVYTYSFNFQESRNEKISYDRDSLVGGQSCKVLLHKRHFADCNYDNKRKITLLKQKGDTVFFRNYITQNTWQILYNFGALPGSSWKYFYVNKWSAVVTNTIYVDGVETVTINGFPLKQLTVHSNLPSLLLPGKSYGIKITERFGSDQFLFFTNDYPEIPTESFHDFLCYRDNSFGNKQFSALPCDFINPLGINELKIETNVLKIYPSPTSDLLNIDFLNPIEHPKIRLLNLLGQEISIFANADNASIQGISNTSFKLDLSRVPTGIYFLQVFEKGKLIANEKIIKE